MANIPNTLANTLVIGISSRALFDLENEDAIYRTKGLDAYRQYQIANEQTTLRPGTGFPLVKAFLELNKLYPSKRLVEVVVMSRNSSETSLRIFNSIKANDLDITRAALTGGAALSPYLKAFNVSLFLSRHKDDVMRAREDGFAAAMVYPQPTITTNDALQQIRIAFDGDAVLFSDEAERIYSNQGNAAFVKHETDKVNEPLKEGPFAHFLKVLAHIQQLTASSNKNAVRTALVTARASPSHERVVRTLRAWNVVIDETFFLGGLDKGEILAAFNPHMFFDDKVENCDNAADKVPTGQVLYRSTVEEGVKKNDKNS